MPLHCDIIVLCKLRRPTDTKQNYLLPTLQQIDSQPHPKCHEFFSFLFNQGVGTMVADLYLGWAYYFESVGSFAKADEIYRMGLGARAQPIELLKRSQMQLQIVVAGNVRCATDLEYDSMLMAHMGERRLALTSLHGQSVNQAAVGSLRTDAAVKSRTPGIVPQQNGPGITSNVVPSVAVLHDHNGEGGVLMSGVPQGGSVESQIKSVVESALKAQENIREPGPWTKCGLKKDEDLEDLGETTKPGMKKKKKLGSLFSKKEIANNPGFEILEDSEETLPEDGDNDAEEEEGATVPMVATSPDLTWPAISLPPGFVRHNEPQDKFKPTLTVHEEKGSQQAEYIKKYVYPTGLDKEYSLEEIRAYKHWSMRSNPGPNRMTMMDEMASFMEQINLPENFAAKNLPQTPFDLEYFPFESGASGVGLQAMCRVLSVNGCHLSYEELLQEKYLKQKQESANIKQNPQQSTTIVEILNDNSIDMDVDGEEGETSPITNDRRSGSPQQQHLPLHSNQSPFELNDTCSTQMFNLFIKPQSISTPNRGKSGGGAAGGGPGKNKSQAVPRSSLALYKHNALAEEEVVGQPQAQPLTRGDIPQQPQQPQQNTSPDTVQYGGGKQLSVIMETTESSASSGGCQTTTSSSSSTDATTIMKGSSSSTTLIDYAVASLTAKPRKSILKRPDCSVVVAEEEQEEEQEQFTIFEDVAEDKVQEPENSSVAATEKVTTKTNNNFSVYCDSMDFFAPPPKMPEFAMPLPPKPKTFMPLYNDSMEQFAVDKARAGTLRMMARDGQEQEQPQDQEPPMEEEHSKVDFSIFQDSHLSMGGGGSLKSMGAIPKERPSQLMSVSSKENDRPDKHPFPSPNVSMSPLKSSLASPSSCRPATGLAFNMDDSMSFLESPKKDGGGGLGARSNNAIYATSTESTMPTIAAIDPLLLEHSMTFPSMKEITGHYNHNNRTCHNNNQSVSFSTLMKRQAGGAGVGGEEQQVAGGRDFGNKSILDLIVAGEGEEKREQPLPPPPPQQFDESMTFNSLMRMEAKGIASIAAGVDNLNLKAEPTTTIKIPKLSFNMLMMDEAEGEGMMLMSAPPQNNNAAADQSVFSMELPSSTAHGFSVFTSKSAGVVVDNHPKTGGYEMRMEKSISPIPTTAAGEEEEAKDEDMMIVEVEEEEVPPNEEEDIYKWENTLRVLPEADVPDPDSWYNDLLPLDVTVQQQPLEGEKGRRRIGDKDYVDPFDSDLINTCLANVDFVNYVHSLNECDMREKIAPLRQGGQLEICDQVFSVRRLIGKGAFGQIYR